MSDYTPPTQPSGDLTPPGRLPPTAVGTATLPSPESDGSRALAVIRRVLLGAMDVADSIANAIRGGRGSR